MYKILEQIKLQKAGERCRRREREPKITKIWRETLE